MAAATGAEYSVMVTNGDHYTAVDIIIATHQASPHSSFTSHCLEEAFVCMNEMNG